MEVIVLMIDIILSSKAYDSIDYKFPFLSVRLILDLIQHTSLLIDHFGFAKK